MAKVIVTIGPGSIGDEVLLKLKDKGADFVRLNLSHTPVSEIKEKLEILQRAGVPVIVDTEGSQVRTGYLGEGKAVVAYSEGSVVKVYGKEISCDEGTLFLRPYEVVGKLAKGDLISVDFDSVLLKVKDNSMFVSEGYVLCDVINGGIVGNNKAVTIDNESIEVAAYSKKDIEAVRIAKEMGIKHFTLSFMDKDEEVDLIRVLYPESVLYAKVETKKGVQNLNSIVKAADGVLIDRGDLSREIALEKIPLTQKIIMRRVLAAGKEVFVATNILESMCDALKPTRAEINDVVNTVLDGVTGLVLTKETAVGGHPLETVAMLKNLISHAELALDPSFLVTSSESEKVLDRLEKLDYVTGDTVIGNSGLVSPHGGKLINRVLSAGDSVFSQVASMKKIRVPKTTIMDAEQICIGTFSPLEGFMTKKQFNSVLDDYKLPNGVIWTIPIFLQVSSLKAQGIVPGEKIVLECEEDGEAYAILNVEDVYSLPFEETTSKFFGTSDKAHPGVRKLFESGEIFLGGKIDLLKRLPSAHKQYEITPKQSRRIFEDKGWKHVIGFHTRNAIHRSHEFIQLEGMKRGRCDGLFIHPVVGKKKPGDFETPIIVGSYEIMMNNFYPKNKVVFGAFSTFSRYGGPREAVFTAVCRKNFGCSHFVIGRDHTGVGKFYGPKDSHNIFDRFPDLGISVICFDQVFYSKGKACHVEDKGGQWPEEDQMKISGTQARQMLLSHEQPPEWFMRPEISSMILEKVKTGHKVFWN